MTLLGSLHFARQHFFCLPACLLRLLNPRTFCGTKEPQEEPEEEPEESLGGERLSPQEAFKVLNAAGTDSKAFIQQQFKELVLQHHPDKVC